LLSRSIVPNKFSLNYRMKKRKNAHTEPSKSKEASPSMFRGGSATRGEDPHFNYSIVEEVEEKRKEFFQKNYEKIKEAMSY
jgi:hypothetical protein